MYDVRPKSSEGPTRTLHQNLLLPCDYLPGKSWEDLPPVKKTRTPAPSHCDDIQPVVQEEVESDSEDDLPEISCLKISPRHDKNDQTQIQLESTSKDEPELYFPGAHSGDVLGETAAAANTTDTPPEAQLTEDPQTVEERNEQENTSNLGRPQHLRQAPKRLTYGSPGEPTYVQQVKVDPYIGIQQYGIPTTPAPYIPEFRVDQYCTLPGAYSSTSCSITHVLEHKYDDDALHALYSCTTAATMGGTIPAISVQINR